MSRVISITATIVATLVLLLATATDASLLPPPQPQGRDPAPKDLPPPMPGQQSWSATYQLLRQFLDAVQQFDFSTAQSLLAADGEYTVTGLSCGSVTPAQLVQWLQAAPVQARWFELEGWTGNAEGAMLRMTVVSVLNKEYGNQTEYNGAMYVYAQVTPDLTKLQKLTVVEDTAARQTNATLMTGVVQTLIDAWRVGDLATYSSLLDAKFQEAVFPQWNVAPVELLNKTVVLESLQNAFAMFPQRTVFQRSLFATCNVVLTDHVSTYVGPTGSRIQHTVTWVELTSAYTVAQTLNFIMG